MNDWKKKQEVKWAPVRKSVSGDLEDTRKTYEKIKEKNGKLQDQTQAVTESLETKESEKEELRRKKETKDSEILLLSHKVESNTLLITHYEELEKQSDEEKDTKTAEIEVLKKETVLKKTGNQWRTKEVRRVRRVHSYKKKRTGILREEDFRGEWPSLFDYEHQFWHKGKTEPLCGNGRTVGDS